MKDEEDGCTCQECLRKYRIDILVSDDIWDIIRPQGATGDGGLLCGKCIIEKLEDLGKFSAFILLQQGYHQEY